jgi:hypothetical protein
LSVSTKTSPEIANLCVFTQVFTAFESPTVGSSCDVENWTFDPSVALGGRLRFRLFPSDGTSDWQIHVSGTGDVPSNCPNTIGGTGWTLVFTAPGSVCPPASGWTYAEDLSSPPVVGDPECNETPFDALVSDFTVGSVTVAEA